MGDSSEKLLAKLASLNDSLDDLEDKLEPLLAQTLPESLLSLETMQQVKLNVVLPYLVYDLIFIYLKTRGIDPKTHPVVQELDRVRQYFDKIKSAEDPERRKTAVDKAAANRFIKHAIAQVRDQRTPGELPGPSGKITRFDDDGNPLPAQSASSSAQSRSTIPVRVTSKMLARQEYEKQLAEEADEDEQADELEVFDDDDAEGEEVEEDGPKKLSSKAKGKARASDVDEVQSSVEGGKKRRRAAVDPFAGYGEETDTKSAKPKKKKKSTTSTEDEDGASTPTTSQQTSTPRSAKEKKGKRKSKKAS